jgi:hypothetical protein
MTYAGSDLIIDGSILLILKIINFNLEEICRKGVDWIQLENTNLLVIIRPIFEELFVPNNVRQQELVPGNSTALLLVHLCLYSPCAARLFFQFVKPYTVGRTLSTGIRIEFSSIQSAPTKFLL